MAYATVIGECFGCKRVFTFSPTRVPSVWIGDMLEPICRDCVDLVNPKRIANGLEPIEVLPGAYEPDDLGEI